MASKQRSFRETAHNPWEATETLPASEERIQLYRSRVAAKQSCFREGDLKEDDRRSIPGIANGPNGKPLPVPRAEGLRSETGDTEVSQVKFSARIRLFRKRRGWTQKELGERAKLSTVVIRFYEYGWRKPTYRSLLRLAEALGVKVAELFPINVQ